MITLRKSQARGHVVHGWLDTYHTFSFAEYFDPAFTQFGPLRVLNQDRIAGGRGFPTHGHANMEIITVVLEGVLEHEDNMGNGSRILPGEVQLMSAGSGVLHSEANPSAHEELHLLQMWVLPELDGTPPRYEQRAFSTEERRGCLRLVVSPDGQDESLTIGQDARLFTGMLGQDERAELELGADRMAWLHVARGSLTVNGMDLCAGDGAGIRDELLLTLDGGVDAELVVWDLPG